jgi:hypothetical protein
MRPAGDKHSRMAQGDALSSMTSAIPTVLRTVQPALWGAAAPATAMTDIAGEIAMEPKGFSMRMLDAFSRAQESDLPLRFR